MRKIFCLLFIVIISFVNAQNYEFIFKVDIKPDSQKDSITTKYMSLDVLNKKSIFRGETDKERDSLESSSIQINSYSTEILDNLYFTKDYKKNEYKKHLLQMYNKYYISINPSLKWVLSKETKKIGDYLCHKAAVNYGGRNWTAWYTNSISINEGPYIFGGLPGFVVLIHDEKNDYNFELIEVKKLDPKRFFERKSPIKISWEDYKKLLKTYYADPSREIRDISTWVDKDGNIVKIDFRDADEKEKRKLKRFNNPLELDNKVDYDSDK